MASEPAAPDWYSHGLNRVAYYRLASAAAAALPRAARLRIARALGRLLARALPAERRAVRSNLGRVLAGSGPALIEAQVAETFANFGAFFADLLTLNRRPGADLRAFVASADGEHHLDAALVSERGVVLLTAHLAGLTTVVAALERVIRAHPTQWFNFFDAWSPPGGHP